MIFLPRDVEQVVEDGLKGAGGGDEWCGESDNHGGTKEALPIKSEAYTLCCSSSALEYYNPGTLPTLWAKPQTSPIRIERMATAI
jgi:hypothetical protein